MCNILLSRRPPTLFSTPELGVRRLEISVLPIKNSMLPFPVPHRLRAVSATFQDASALAAGLLVGPKWQLLQSQNL